MIVTNLSPVDGARPSCRIGKHRDSFPGALNLQALDSWAFLLNFVQRSLLLLLVLKRAYPFLLLNELGLDLKHSHYSVEVLYQTGQRLIPWS